MVTELQLKQGVLRGLIEATKEGHKPRLSDTIKWIENAGYSGDGLYSITNKACAMLEGYSSYSLEWLQEEYVKVSGLVDKERITKHIQDRLEGIDATIHNLQEF